MRKVVLIVLAIALIGGVALIIAKNKSKNRLKANLAGSGLITIGSSAFGNNQAIPTEYTCQGINNSPNLHWSGIPLGAKSLALLAEDQDAPGGYFVHWAVWNISPTTLDIKKGFLPPEAKVGMNDFNTSGYSGPCPSSGKHSYHFMLYALDNELQIPASGKGSDLRRAMNGHIIDQAVLTGTFEKK